MNITIESKAFKIIMDDLALIKATVKAMSMNNGFSKWMTEAEAREVTGLCKSSLQKKRKAGIFRFSTSTGRKIKYLRKDVEGYLNGNIRTH